VREFPPKVTAAAPRSQRHAGRPSLGSLLPPFLRRDERDERIRAACLMHGYTVRSVAEHLRLHPSTVSKVLGRCG